MLDWSLLQREYDELQEQLIDPSLDQKTRIAKQKRSSQLADVLDMHNQIVALEKNIVASQALCEVDDQEMRELAQQEVQEASTKKALLEKELEDVLYPADERDDSSVFVEIRAGAGGQEAALFAADLHRMYSMYAENKGWHSSVVEENSTDLGGFKELIVHVQGKRVYKHLKFESGVHRVQRVPKTEAAGRVHTSTVTVAVLPEVDDVEINISPADLRIDTYRAGGAGGQHVNKTDSAVRITHVPSGLVVACQDERSQIKNRQKAMKILQARLLAFEREKQESQISADRKQQIGTGERAEKIRTYNFPQNRVTDHRTEVTLKKLDMVMEGDLDDLIMPLIDWERAKRREKSSLGV
ncbi:peptide chain release factor 1 [bacterium]|nr:peptide chain release factor 1 [bacterium]